MPAVQTAERNARVGLRRHGITRVLWIVLGLNLIVALAKLYYGWRSHAISISADGVHSLLDGASNVIGLVGLEVARRPPDANHPYGHRKYETFAALGIALMMFFGCYEIGAAAVNRVLHPRLPEITAAGFAIVLMTIGINLFVVWFERREGRRLQSEILLSDSVHTWSDVMASVIVLVSFTAVRLGVPWADAAAAAAIILLILRAGFAILLGTLSTLSDERRIAPDEIEAAALGEAGVLEAHNVRTRGPDDDIHLDLHILVDPAMAISDAHHIGHRVEERLRRLWPGLTDVVVHVEPALESERAHEREGGGLKAPG
jgi:cation diffusion facilitator family transporter